MRKKVYTSVIFTLLILLIISTVISGASGLETNLIWSPGSTSGQTFVCTDQELRVGETYETASATSDKIVDGKESFVFELEYNLQSLSNSESIVRYGWISQAVTIGTVKFFLNQDNTDGPYYGIQKYRVDMTAEEAKAKKIVIKVIYDSTTKLLSYEVQGRYIVSVPFEGEGAIKLSSAWCAWSVSKAVYTSYPGGLPQELCR